MDTSLYLPGTTPAQAAAATVMASVIALMAQDPQIKAMAETNDKERFIEGCQNSPQFRAKFTRAILAVQELTA